MSRITIEVDGRPLEAEAGEMLICVTDRNDIYIPRFCYHDRLSVAANCRMCLVEVERAPKPMPACATPVMDGMKVFTRSDIARTAQEGTMEFLLINHPLDCPVCDQGGECPLQDQAMGYGKDDSRFQERKRSVPSHDIGPLIATEMTRCIHCTRCVRFGEEVAGVMEMGAPGRGEFMTINTFLNRSIDSEVSGNIIDLCPVGALTSRPYRFAARSWELRNHCGISPHDCLGTNINIQTLRDRVERVLPIENADINDCWLADRDRFSYEAVNSEHRLTQPMIREDGEWKEVSWEAALGHAAEGIRAVIETSSPSAVGALASPVSTLQEFYLLQKLLRSLGSENIDHRLQQCDFRDDDIAPRFPASEIPIREYDHLESVVLVGSNLRKEQPLLSLRLRQGQLKTGTSVSAINPMDFDFNFNTAELRVAPGPEMLVHLGALAESVARIQGVSLPPEIGRIGTAKAMESTARGLVDAGEKGLIVIGALAQQHRDASIIRAIAHWVAENTGCKLAVLAPANSVAGWLANCLPGARGLNAEQMRNTALGAMILLGTEPELDSIHGKDAFHALEKAGFVVQISAFKSESTMQYADALLPMAAFAESAGTYVNCEGRAQRSEVAATPRGESRPAWKILRVLGNFLEQEGFDYITLDDVSEELEATLDLSGILPSARLTRWKTGDPQSTPGTGLFRIAELPMYRLDPTLRHARALQRTADNPPPAVTVHPDTVQRLNLAASNTVRVKNGAGEAVLPLKTDRRVPGNAAYIPAGFLETAPLGGQVSVTLESA